jgi:cellulose synthase/poly-beta-1,6-N-acetylglucosamine synthase-like glycosyltransferase
MTTIVTFYFVCAFLLAVYGINTHILVKLFSRHYPGRKKTDKAFLADFYSQNSPIENISEGAANLPSITTQLPVFNELNVVERLIDAVAVLHYPKGLSRDSGAGRFHG